jgi:hypothetical protein
VGPGIARWRRLREGAGCGIPERGNGVEGPVMTAIRNTTRNLVEAIWADEWPRNGAIVDFGLRTQAHYEALYDGVRDGQITAGALDAALGRGEALTALARSARSNPHREIAFRTDWDDLRDEEGPDGDAGRAG